MPFFLPNSLASAVPPPPPSVPTTSPPVVQIVVPATKKKDDSTTQGVAAIPAPAQALAAASASVSTITSVPAHAHAPPLSSPRLLHAGCQPAAGRKDEAGDDEEDVGCNDDFVLGISNWPNAKAKVAEDDDDDEVESAAPMPTTDDVSLMPTVDVFGTVVSVDGPTITFTQEQVKGTTPVRLDGTPKTTSVVNLLPNFQILKAFWGKKAQDIIDGITSGSGSGKQTALVGPAPATRRLLADLDPHEFLRWRVVDQCPYCYLCVYGFLYWCLSCAGWEGPQGKARIHAKFCVKSKNFALTDDEEKERRRQEKNNKAPSSVMVVEKGQSTLDRFMPSWSGVSSATRCVPTYVFGFVANLLVFFSS
jgi:hypothetical protein